MRTIAHELAELLPEGAKRPSPEDFKTIRNIATSRNGGLEELSDLLAELERKALTVSQSAAIQAQNFSVRDSILRLGVQLGQVPNFSDPELMIKHSERLGLVRKAVEASGMSAGIEDGGLKSRARVEEKLNKKLQRKRQGGLVDDFIYLQDATRLRVIAEDFDTLDQLYPKIYDELTASGLRQVGYMNRYLPHEASYTACWRGINSSWVSEKLREGHPSDGAATEIQFVTKRVYSLMNINHPFDVSKLCTYPSPQHREWLYRTFLKASILDLEDFLSEE